MIGSMTRPAALYFDPDAYTEAHKQAGVPSGPAGLMGRQVAGKEFLDAYLAHARSDTLTAVVRSKEKAEVLARIVREHPASRQRPRKLRVHLEGQFLPDAPASVLHIPCPPEAR